MPSIEKREQERAIVNCPETSSRPHRLYLPQLDVMRFFAFLAVFFFHSLPSPNIGLHTGLSKAVALVESVVERSGESGVGLFFLLSAYLITELLRREKDLSGAVHLKLFYIRRALRIWPLYYLAVGIGVVFSLSVAALHLTRTDILTYVFFLKNWDVVYRGWNWNPIYILWTVSAEEQFYLVWPFAQKVLNRRSLMVLCFVTMIAIPLLVFRPSGIVMRHHGTQQMFTFLYFPIGCLISLVLGGRRKEASSGVCLALLATGVGFWFAGTYLVSSDGTSEGRLALLVAGKCVILLGTIAVFFAFLKSSPKLSLRPLIYLGKISFGLYVFHKMAIYLVEGILSRLGVSASTGLASVVLHLTLSLAVTAAAAALSYEMYEKRFLVLKDRFAIVHSRAV